MTPLRVAGVSPASGPSEEYAASARYVLHDRGGDHLLVLLHGLGGDRNQPLGLTGDQFADTGLSVLAPDARAHGETTLIGAAEEFTSANLAQDVLALVDAIGLGDRCLIPVGISMGAAVALELLLGHRERVAGAVLIRPSFGPEPWPEHALVFQHIAALLRSSGAAGRAEFLASASFAEVHAVSASAAASLAEQFVKPRSVERVVRLETVPSNTAADWDEPVDVGRPVTVIGAQGDPGHPLAVAEAWHAALVGSELTVVPSRDADPLGYTTHLAQTTRAAVRRIAAG